MYATARRSWGVVEQTCPWCTTTRPVGEFWRNPDTGWITKECRPCAEERLRLWTEVERNPVVVGKRFVNQGDGPLMCTRCGRCQPRAAFYTYKDSKSDRRYYRPKCKQCMGAEQNARQNEYNRTPDRRRVNRDRWLRSKYGIGIDEYDALLVKQGGQCAICRTDEPGGPTPDSAFHVDHCHDTARVRGLLCRSCNTAIGLLREDPALFAAAAAYLA